MKKFKIAALAAKRFARQNKPERAAIHIRNQYKRGIILRQQNRGIILLEQTKEPAKVRKQVKNDRNHK